MPKFEIKSWFSGKVLFSVETSSFRLAVEAAVKGSADLRSADLRSADLRSADLRYADLRYANLRSADLSSADLRYADLRYANLRYADLRSADLRYADLRSANLRSANLSSADLSSANLRSADLRYANLRYANLRSADLRYANLRSADLRSADLRSADLRYADLRYANLSSAKGVNKHLSTPLLLLHDQPDKVRAYKLVNEAYQGPWYPEKPYEIGKTYTVEVANCDPSQLCAAGISLATLDWCMKEWRIGFHILIAEFTAADIAVIPTATDGKFRVKKCKIVGEKDLVEIGLVPDKKEILFRKF